MCAVAPNARQTLPFDHGAMCALLSCHPSVVAPVPARSARHGTLEYEMMQTVPGRLMGWTSHSLWARTGQLAAVLP
ncbi:hypothetical protein ABID26_000632 [Mesorhizobium shonense]|uniref:Uncharacterized protein n=1 Tax=Mesorhizobium shonense TaxID=1209948 RepID=A0ABV2HL13_9HYPH